MLRKSRNRALKAFIGSAMLLALPFATGCQSANFGANLPGYGLVSGWWGGDADKIDADKPPRGYQLPSSRAEPNGDSYAGARGARGGYETDAGGAEGGYSRQGYASQNSYATGNRANPNNWGGANRKASGYSAEGEVEGDYPGSEPQGYSASRNGAASPGYDPYGGNAPSNARESSGPPPRTSAYSADARSGGYGNRLASGSQRATRYTEQEEEGYDAEPSGYGGGSRYSDVE
jgi:hypothetical protein